MYLMIVVQNLSSCLAVAHEELSCLLSFGSSTPILHIVGLLAHFAEWSIKGEDTEQRRVNLSIVTFILGSPTFNVAYLKILSRWPPIVKYFFRITVRIHSKF